MKVLVLGGTGAMGIHLVHLLSNNGGVQMHEKQYVYGIFRKTGHGMESS